MFERQLSINLPKGQSAFLWGPRKTGKTTFLRDQFPKSLVYDFLKTDLFFELSKNPHHFREQLLVQKASVLRAPIILDEVQKVPQVMDEVHWLIENKKLTFILCGSSARKLKRGHANMLGGRAWRFEMHPLVSREIPEFNLLKALNRGLVPIHYLQDSYERSHKAYIQDYLKEEIFEEGLTRNIPAFSRFFDAMAYSHGELTNFSNISRDCGVDSKTVKAYYQILVDTLLGVHIEPFKKRQHRQVIGAASKFYLFDVGIAGALTKRVIKEERGEHFGRAFEHLILMELLAYRAYKDMDFSIQFWRTKAGLEVDFILGNGEVALEVKGSQRIDNNDLKSLAVFSEEMKPKKTILVSNEKIERLHGKLRIIPWRDFLNRLWSGEIIH